MNPRHALYVAAVALSLVGMAGMAGNGVQDAPAPAQTPLTATPAPLPTVIDGWERPAPVRALTFEVWRATQVPRIATEGEARTALTDAGMAPHEAARLAYASANCEAPVFDRDGTSIGIDLYAVGDQGRAVGAFQIRRDVHPHLARRYDLTNLEQAASAAVAVRNEAGGLNPWSCVK